MGRKKVNPVSAILSSWSAVAFIVVIIVATVWTMVDDGESGGKSHKCVSDTMTAEVSVDGSLHVVDSRTYNFTGSWTLTADDLEAPANGETIVNGVSVTDANGVTTTLEEVPFQTSWRTAGGPPSGHYAVDTARETIYAFSSTTDADKTFTFDYTYTNAVNQYQDVDILYWQFVAKGWDVDTNNAKLTLTLPVPAGQSVTGGENVYAFGHGSLGGDVVFNDNGTITFDVPKVEKGTFAELRVAFPRDWTPSIDPVQVNGSEGLQSMLAEEKKWQDEAAAKRLQMAMMIYIPFGVSALCLIVAIVLFLRYGKEYKPQTPLDYWRDVPEKGAHPAVIGRLWRWNKEDANDITATLMHLSNMGVVRIERQEVLKDRKILPDKMEAVYHLILDPDKRDALSLEEIDRKVLSLIFDKVGRHELDVSLSDLEKYAKKNAESYVSSVENWNLAVDKEVEKHDFFEKKGNSLRGAFLAAALILPCVGFGLSMLLENLWPLFGLIPGAVILLVFSHFMPRRSREAVEIHERCEALKRWFKDFTALDQAVPTDAKVWGELLVYAYIFGVADEVVENLNRVAPQIWQDSTFSGSLLWYYNPYGPIHTSAAGQDFFGKAFENTFQSAKAAVTAAQSSSGGGGFGGGGGFSGGGGGGFGGGGGGFSR